MSFNAMIKPEALGLSNANVCFFANYAHYSLKHILIQIAVKTDL